MGSKILDRHGGTTGICALAAAVGLAAAGLWLGWIRDLPAPSAPVQLPWWALAVLFFLGEVCVVHLYFRRNAHSFTLNEVAIVLGLFLAAPEDLLLGGLVGTTVALGFARRQKPVKLAFNFALFFLEAGLALLVFHAASESVQELGLRNLAAAFLAMLATTAVGALLVSAAITLSEGGWRFPRLSQALGLGVLVTVANTSLALVAAVVAWHEPQFAWLLLAPAAVLFLAYRAVLAERRGHSQLEFLYQASRLVHESEQTEAAIVSLLSQIRTRFRADLAELILFSEDAEQPAFRTVLGPGEGRQVMAPVDRTSTAWVETQVSTNGGAMLLERSRESAGLEGHLSLGLFKDAMVAPLEGETRTLGTLLVANRLGDVGTFDAKDLKLFEALGRHAGLALEKSRLEQSLAQRLELEEKLRLQNEELAALHGTALGLAERLDLESLLEAIVTRAGALLDTRHCYVYLAHPGSDHLSVQVGTGVFDDSMGYRLSAGEGLAGRVWESAAPLVVEDYRTWSGRSADFDGREIRAVVGVPLRSGPDVVGVLGLAYLEEGRTFDQAEVDLLSRFGHLASLALENARLYRAAQEELHERRRAEEALGAAELRYRTLVEQLPLVTYIRPLDPSRGNIYASPQVEVLLGYSVEEWENDPDILSRIVHPDDRDLVLAECARLRETGEPFYAEYRYVRKDGRIVWVLDETRLVRDESGEPLWVQGYLLDITQRKAAEEARARLAAIVESSSDAIFSATLEGFITSWNAGAERIYGYSAEEVLGRPVTMLMPPERRHEMREILGTIRRGEDISNYETVRLAKERTHFDASVSVSPVRDAAGAIIGASAITRDITERKRAASRLQQKTEFVELLQAIASAANESATVEEAMQICLDRVCAHTGWPVGHVYRSAGDGARELVPTTIWTLERPVESEAFRSITEATRFAPGVGLPGRVFASGKPLWVMDVTKDSNFPRARWAEEAGLRAGFAFPVLVGAEVAAVLEFFSNEAIEPDAALLEVMGQIGTQLGRAVERGRAEQALRESEEHHRSIVETANDAFIAIDAGGTIRDWNAQAELTFGWKRDEVIGLELAETMIPAEYRNSYRKGLARLLATGESAILGKTLELPALHRDGRELPVELKIWLAPAGEGPRFNAFVRDISERRALEEQLRHSQKMEAVGRLAGGVAHDFNNLLTAISGYSELLLAGLEGDELSSGRVEEIRRAAERAASLTRQLLTFSRRQVVQPRVLDVGTVVTDMERMLRRLIGEDIELVTSVAGELAEVRADRGQLEQVIVNLAVNARDAMPTGGRLTIATARVNLDELKARLWHVSPGPYLELKVADTGCGMDEATQAHIFEPFFTTKELGKGTGLGLATVYGIVEQGGGCIMVESAAGEGATFAVYLPISAGAAEPEPERARGSSPHGTETVLLVEDEEIVRTLVCELLEAQGYAVLQAPHGDAALEICREHEGAIDLMLTDVVMPGMSGPDLFARAGELQPELKVIYMSGYTDDAIVHHGVREAEVVYLQKPFTSDKLASTLRGVLEGAGQSKEPARAPTALTA